MRSYDNIVRTADAFVESRTLLYMISKFSHGNGELRVRGSIGGVGRMFKPWAWMR